MKRLTIILITLLLLFAVMQTVSADDINIDIKDKYLISDVKNFDGTVNIQDAHKYKVTGFIDYRNIETECHGGGHITDTDEYVLPYDLGLGKHNICFIVKDDDGNIISKSKHQFYVVKNYDDDLNMYTGSPYYYDGGSTDEKIEEDYDDFLNGMNLTDDEEIDDVEDIPDDSLEAYDMDLMVEWLDDSNDIFFEDGGVFTMIKTPQLYQTQNIDSLTSAEIPVGVDI